MSFISFLRSADHQDFKDFPRTEEDFARPVYGSGKRPASWVSYNDNRLATQRATYGCQVNKVKFVFDETLSVEFPSCEDCEKLWNGFYRKAGGCTLLSGLATGGAFYIAMTSKNRMVSIAFTTMTIITACLIGLFYRRTQQAKVLRDIASNVDSSLYDPALLIAKAGRKLFYKTTWNEWKAELSKQPAMANAVTRWERELSYCEWMKTFLDSKLGQTVSDEKAWCAELLSKEGPFGDELLSPKEKSQTLDFNEIRTYIRSAFVLDWIEDTKPYKLEVQIYLRELNLQKIGDLMGYEKVRKMAKEISDYLSQKTGVRAALLSQWVQEFSLQLKIEADWNLIILPPSH